MFDVKKIVRPYKLKVSERILPILLLRKTERKIGAIGMNRAVRIPNNMFYKMKHYKMERIYHMLVRTDGIFSALSVHFEVVC